MGLGNTELIEYGILNENSDVRVHITELAAYIFWTKQAQEIIKCNEYPIKPSYQWIDLKRVHTADGWCVPICDIPHKKVILPENYKVSFHANERQKGELAEQIVNQLIQDNLFPSSYLFKIEPDINAQLKGTDMYLKNKIQIKCDLPIEKWGNFYLQIRECNPQKLH